MMKNLIVEIEDRVAYVTLDRPEKRNALNPALISELHKAFDQLFQNQDIKVVVIKANGEVFSAGADLEYLKTIQNNSLEDNLVDSRRLKDLFLKIYTFPKPTIAQVHGHAIAGGCGLVNVCDFVFSTPEAKFGYTEVKIGFIPALVMVFLVRKIGESRARELLLSGLLIDAEKAQNYGLVAEVVSSTDLPSYVSNYAQSICTNNSASSLELTKKMLGKISDLHLEEALDYASKENAAARSTQDCIRGIKAFMDKEKIMW